VFVKRLECLMVYYLVSLMVFEKRLECLMECLMEFEMELLS
jgi:hypothetical protein